MAKTLALLSSVSLFLLGEGCGLIPSRLTECSVDRPCATGQTCDYSSSTCVESPDALDPMSMMMPSLPTKVPDVIAPECIGECEPCMAHGDCASQVCNYSQPSYLGGSCAAPSEVVYVDNHNGTCTADGDGDSIATALCTLSDGLARIDGIHKRVVRLLPSAADYGSATVVDQSVSIIGPGGASGSAQLRGNKKNAEGMLVLNDGVTILGNSRVFIDGIDVTSSNVGILCNGADSASLSVRKSRITSNSDIGILVSECTVSIDRVLLRDNGSGGIAIGGRSGKKSFSITNSFIVENHSYALPAVLIGATGPGRFDSNTVADNKSVLSAGIECSQPNVTILNSIVIANPRYESQIKTCPVQNTVVGLGDAANGIHENPTFARVSDINYGLDTRPTMNSCCVNKVPCSSREDYFGIARPRGPLCDIGAHEAK